MEKERIEEIAANRLQLITPLIDPMADKDKVMALKEEISVRSGLSERTLRRYMRLYQEKGFDGLKPQCPGHGGKSVIPENLIDEAVALRREIPRRSIADITTYGSWNGKERPARAR